MTWSRRLLSTLPAALAAPTVLAQGQWPSRPHVRARLCGQGAEVVAMEPAEQDRFFEAERKRWAQVVAQAGIKPD
ncbi:hypothetical protein [Ramlibacter sp. 18x22-1]|uniref:hypothetical protein n=1 Tax=Ramlibacter humi TaxID=2530451 RepID=UPI00197CBFE4